jgi:hypothetical protein
MRRLAMLTVLAALVCGVMPARAAFGTASESSRPPATGDPDASRGLVIRGLAAGTGACAGGYQLEAGGRVLCTSGPDASPRGIDVRATRSLAQLQIASAGPAALDTLSASTAESQDVPVIGDGTSGNRVLAVYAVASDRADRYAEVAPLIAGWAAYMDNMVNTSAALTGGERHIRFVTDPTGSLVVAKVILPPGGDDTFGATVDALMAAGYNSRDRVYVIWTDAAVYCGIATVFNDDRPTADNYSNGRAAQYARIDQGCWGSAVSTELHELVHNLGAVQLSAPHATSAFHCTDEYDRMCYADGAGVQLTYDCPLEMEKYLDCGHDDYFNTDPPVGSYLATHWNVANSSFLETGAAASEPVPPPSTTDRAPVVSVSGPAAVTLPSSAVLDGTVSDDGLPGPYTVLWSVDSGPGAVVFAEPGAEDTTAVFSVAGSYVLRLTADDGELTESATLTIAVVDPAPRQTTAVFTGSLSKKWPCRTFQIDATAGPAQAVLTFGNSGSGKRSSGILTLNVYDVGGRLVATALGTSPVRMSVSLAGGSYTLQVSGALVSFSLEITWLML